MELSPTSPAPLAARLQTVLVGLRTAMAGWGLQALVTVLLYRRLGVITRRIDGLLRRFRAGSLRQRAARTAPSAIAGGRRPAQRLPHRIGWLLAAGRHHAAVFTVRLESILREQEMAELLAASPAAVRLLRPLCRALSVDLPMMRPAPRPPKPLIRQKRTRRPMPDLGRIPLPRGALTWARRDGFGKW